jgi:hypothetical protein
MRGFSIRAMHGLNSATSKMAMASQIAQLQGLACEFDKDETPHAIRPWEGFRVLGFIQEPRFISNREMQNVARFGRSRCGDSLFSRNSSHLNRKSRMWSTAMASTGSRDFASIRGKKTGQKTKVNWVCENCGESYAQWWGSCKNCKGMNTLKEFREAVGNAGKRGGAAARAVENLSLASVRHEVKTKVEYGGVRNSPRSGSRAWLENVGSNGPQRLSDVAKGHSKLHWRLPLYAS